MKKVNETGQLTQPKSKLDEFMTKQGKTLKPAKQPIVPKDGKKVTKKEISIFFISTEYIAPIEAIIIL